MMGQFLTIWQPLLYLLSDAAVGGSDALILSVSGGDFQFEFSGTLNWAMKLLRPAMKSWESVDSKNGINFYDRTIFDHLAAIFLTAVRRRPGGRGEARPRRRQRRCDASVESHASTGRRRRGAKFWAFLLNYSQTKLSNKYFIKQNTIYLLLSITPPNYIKIGGAV